MCPSSRASHLQARKVPGPADSASVVLATSELLESILLSLDMRSLLTSAVRVCRQWRDLIRGSLYLQRALFFERDEAEPPRTREVTFNPLLAEVFPLLFDLAAAPRPGPPRGFNDLALEALPAGRRRAAFYRRGASWRRMHLRQPPVRLVGLWTLDAIRLRKETMRMLRCDGGLRMEGFYSLVLKHVYWWDLFVRWGEAQGRQLPHFKHVRLHMAGAAEDMVRTADVTVAGIADGYCLEEGKARRSVDGSGLVRMAMGRPVASDDRTNEGKARELREDSGLVKLGIFWFKVMETDVLEVLLEKQDGAFCCKRHCHIEALPYAVPL